LSTLTASRRRHVPRLLLLVFLVGVALSLLTAAGLAQVVGTNVSDSAIEATTRADGALASNVIGADLMPSDLAMVGSDPTRVANMEQVLRALTHTDTGLLRVKIHAPDGTVLFSDDPTLRGAHLKANDGLEAALAGKPSTDLVTPDEFAGEEADLAGLSTAPVLEEYLPVRDASGAVVAVFETYRDASPLLAQVGQAQLSVELIVGAASLILILLLAVIFGAAQRRLDRQTRQLVEAARRDPLTGLLNHGAIVERLEGMIRDAVAGGGAGGDQGAGRRVGVALVDIDNFRLFNDTYGHSAGDYLLLEVARLLREELSQASELGRYGPDEFLAVAPPQCAHDLEPAIARLRERLSGVELRFAGSERLPVTISAGLGDHPEHGATATALLTRVTVALVEAKASGGDAVRVSERPAGEVRERNSFDIFRGLVIAVDTKDRYTKRHSEDVAHYALLLADRLGLDPELRRVLQVAGLLHDVGKIGIPDAILRKPGSLTPEEYDIVKQHVALGDMIVRDLPNLDLVRAGVRHHHERWDGKGYLDGLAGEGIPLVARILAVGDAFSAMTTTRPYRKALSVDEALKRLTDAAGSQLDPELTGAFVEVVTTAPEMTGVTATAPERTTPALWVPTPRVA
jgi:diguanylate cyclase (GGDEF)-like protein/putative nucleotidyltransferase with HDIG domain